MLCWSEDGSGPRLPVFSSPPSVRCEKSARGSDTLPCLEEPTKLHVSRPALKNLGLGYGACLFARRTNRLVRGSCLGSRAVVQAATAALSLPLASYSFVFRPPQDKFFSRPVMVGRAIMIHLSYRDGRHTECLASRSLCE